MGVKLNLCCGDHILPGWVNCDPRAAELGQGVVEWAWGDHYPLADIVLVSYGFMYLEKLSYMSQLVPIASDGATLIIREDDDRQRKWGNIGQNKRGIGVIKSTSNEDEMAGLMEAAGFRVWRGVPWEYRDVLRGHKTAAKTSYVLTGEGR